MFTDAAVDLFHLAGIVYIKLALFKSSYHKFRGAPVAQWVKRWPTDLTVSRSSSAR